MRRMKNFRLSCAYLLPAVVLLLVAAPQTRAQQDVRSIYLEAREHLIDEEFEEALTLFRKVVSDYPQSVYADDAQFYVGYTLEQMGRTEEAIEAYGELIRRWPDSIRVETARSHQIELMGGVGEPAFRQSLEQILSGSMSWEVRREVASAMARSGDFSAAGVLEEVMRRESSSRQMELIRILGDHLTDPAARSLIAMGLGPSRSTSVQLLALRTLKPVAAESEVTRLIEVAISRSNSSSVQQEVIQTLSPVADRQHVRTVIARGMGKGYPSSVQLMAVRALGGYLLDPQVRPAVISLYERSAPTSVQAAALKEMEGDMNRSEITEVLAAAVHNRNPSSVQLKAMKIARSSGNPEVRRIARLGLAPPNPSSVQIEAVRALAEGENDTVAAEALAEMLAERSMPSSVQLAGLQALSHHMQTPAAPGGVAAALDDSKPSSVQMEALELAAPFATNSVIKQALLRILAPGSTPSSVQLKAIQLLERRIEEPQIQEIIQQALHHSNPSSVQLAAVEALDSQAGQAGVREALIGGLTRRNPSSVVLACMEVLDVFVSRDPEINEAYVNLMRNGGISSTARIRAAGMLLPGADAALKRLIADSMEELVAKLHRNWRRSRFSGAPRLIDDAIDIVAQIDSDRAQELRSRYGRPPGLLDRLLGFLFRR